METKYLKLPIFILFSSQVSRNSLKTFKSHKVSFFVFSLSKLSENSFTCSSISKTNLLAAAIILNNTEATTHSSSETQGQLVGTTGFSWANVCNKSGRAPGHLLLPNEFQKRLKSYLLIGQKNFFFWQSAKRNNRATLMSSYTRLFSSSIAVVAWPVQREHF